MYHSCLGCADQEIGVPIAVDIPCARHRNPENRAIAIGIGQIDSIGCGRADPVGFVGCRRAQVEMRHSRIRAGTIGADQEVGVAIAVDVPGARH